MNEIHWYQWVLAAAFLLIPILVGYSIATPKQFGEYSFLLTSIPLLWYMVMMCIGAYLRYFFGN